MKKQLFLDDFYNMTIAELVKIPKKEVRRRLSQARLIERCLESLVDGEWEKKSHTKNILNNEKEENDYEYNF